MIAYLLFFAKDWSQLRDIDKLGGFLQGAFAPLAFGWLAIAVYLQKAELQQSTRALLLQADELKHVVQQHKDQTELWRQERASETSKDEERRLLARLDDLLKHISRVCHLTGVNHGNPERPSWLPVLGRSEEIDEFIKQGRYDQGFLRVLSRVQNFLRDHRKTQVLWCEPAAVSQLREISQSLKQVCSASHALKSDVVESRLSLSGLHDLHKSIVDAIAFLQAKAR